MNNIPTPEIWFLTGSQHLYGEGPLKQVAANSKSLRTPPAEACLQAGPYPPGRNPHHPA